MRFAIFPLHLSKVLRLPGKSDARSYEVLHLSRQIIFPKLKIWCRNQRPHLLTALISCTAPATRNASCQILSICPTPAIVFETATKPSRFAHFWQGAQSLAERQKVLRASQFFTLLTSKRAARHNGVHFFRHLNFQKWSEHEVLCTFWLGNVLRATMACTFSTSQLLKVLRLWASPANDLLHEDGSLLFREVAWPQRNVLPIRAGEMLHGGDFTNQHWGSIHPKWYWFNGISWFMAFEHQKSSSCLGVEHAKKGI